MSSEQATEDKEGYIGPREAYRILLQRQVSEDRIVVERTNIFLAANSILFVAFVMLEPAATILRIALPILGILLTLSLYYLNRAAINALAFWHIGQRKIEEEAPEFDYMRKNSVTPHIDGYQCTWGQKEWKRNKEGKWALEPVGKRQGWWRKPLPVIGTGIIYKLYFPLMFLALWIVSLVVVIAS